MGISIHNLGERIHEARRNTIPTAAEHALRLSRRKKYNPNKAKKGITREELLQRMQNNNDSKGVVKSISQWENGVIPSTQKIVELCNALNISTGYLFGEYDESQIDTHYIREKLGLSEKAQKNIMSLQDHQRFMLSVILSNDSFIESLKKHDLFGTMKDAKDLLDLKNSISNNKIKALLENAIYSKVSEIRDQLV